LEILEEKKVVRKTSDEVLNEDTKDRKKRTRLSLCCANGISSLPPP
jgi:hypothetical protein